MVAENLGVITPEVEAMRRSFGFPGMAILQFAFGNDPQGPSFRPHNYERKLVAYTGGHDNNTTVGWWTGSGGDSTSSKDDMRRERECASSYLNVHGEAIQWAMIRALMASVADTVLIPMQDLLGLGSAARMNQPGRMEGNWKWRYASEQVASGDWRGGCGDCASCMSGSVVRHTNGPVRFESPQSCLKCN